MAKTRTLPDKYYDKDYETNGIHRVPLWRIAGFALNNTATNLYLMFMNYVSFYLLGFVGVGMVMASSFTMAMRIWDGVTDPFIGYMVDQLSPKSLAAMYYISPSYLSSLFKQDTGTTLTDFINTQRIQRAANLLSSTEQNISVVAEQVGILDVNYFTKMFKKSMGSTPTQYRRQSRAR